MAIMAEPTRRSSDPAFFIAQIRIDILNEHPPKASPGWHADRKTAFT
jgi:hypothetical protein